MNPYNKLDEKFFWKKAIAIRSLFDIKELWDPKFELKNSDKIATFGSCFAQHIGRVLVARNFNWLNTEPAPKGLSKDETTEFNHNVFSCRTGNIYTTSLLKQWVEWALLKKSPK